MANDIIDNKTGTLITEVPSEKLKKLNEEVKSEFNTSKDSVYKEALRSLILLEDKYKKQINQIQNDLEKVGKVKVKLEEAYLAGELISREDAKKAIGMGKYSNNFDEDDQ